MNGKCAQSERTADFLRYRETGQVHMDFHRTTNATIAYLRETYGQDFLDDVLRRTAHDVYKSIHEDLKQGSSRQLVEHWRHFFDREGADYALEETGDGIRLSMRKCPAIAYLEQRGIPVDPEFCRQTVVINQALAEGTPFEITTEALGHGRCVQIIKERDP
jgi:predicted ArsR family transcriptional regulator